MGVDSRPVGVCGMGPGTLQGEGGTVGAAGAGGVPGTGLDSRIVSGVDGGTTAGVGAEAFTWGLMEDGWHLVSP